MFEYQTPDNTMTLRQALAELRAAETDISETVSAGTAAALEAHDVVHILFGLDISDIDEVVAHGWMLFGTTLTMAEMHAVARHRDHRRLTAAMDHGKRGALLLKALPRLVRACVRARRMTKLWPWMGYVAHLDRPLNDLRREFGIVVDPPSFAARPRGPHHRRTIVQTLQPVQPQV
jgi:ubiquinone biosynthesis protein Coq4